MALLYTQGGVFLLSKNLGVWIEGTIIAALAMALSFIPIDIGSSFSISLGMIPMTLYCFRRGFVPGIVASFLWGVLHFVVGEVYFLSVPQVLIEYLFAFLFIGFAGLFAKNVQLAIQNNSRKGWMKWIIIGTLVGTVARYFWHFVAGVVFWGEFAFGGMSPVVFSLVMNGASGLATAIATIMVLSILAVKAPALFVPKDSRFLLKGARSTFLNSK